MSWKRMQRRVHEEDILQTSSHDSSNLLPWSASTFFLNLIAKHLLLTWSPHTPSWNSKKKNFYFGFVNRFHCLSTDSLFKEFSSSHEVASSLAPYVLFLSLVGGSFSFQWNYRCKKTMLSHRIGRLYSGATRLSSIRLLTFFQSLHFFCQIIILRPLYPMGVHQSSKLPFLESRGKDEFHPEFSLNNRLGNEPVSFFFSIMTEVRSRYSETIGAQALSKWTLSLKVHPLASCDI